MSGAVRGLGVLGAALAALALPTLALPAAPAQAHTGLVAAVPAAEATVRAVDQVELEFSESVLPDLAVVRVEGPDGPVDLPGGPQASGRRVLQPVGSLAPGTHVVRFRVVASDGHPVTGETSFVVRAAAGSPSSAPAAPATGAGPAAAGPAGPAPDPTAEQAAAARAADTSDQGGTGLAAAAVAGAVLLAGGAVVARRRATAPVHQGTARG